MKTSNDDLLVIEKACKDMNKDMRYLMRVCHNKNPTDETYGARRTLNTAINTDPTVVIKMVGPYLLKYAEKISGREESFFVNSTFDSEIDELGESPEKASLMINAVKTAYKLCTKKESQKIMDVTEDMLSHYCEYKMVVGDM